jgi:transcriptional regulator GlxA family with amidase domain
VHGRVVRDGNLITAGGVTAGIDFGLAVVRRAGRSGQAEAVQLGLEYAPAPPFNADAGRGAGRDRRSRAAQLAATRKAREAIGRPADGIWIRRLACDAVSIRSVPRNGMEGGWGSGRDCGLVVWWVGRWEGEGGE